MPYPTFNRLSVLLALGASAALGACHDWTQYDPRVGSSSSTSTSTSGSGGDGSGGGGGAGGAGVMCTYPMDDFATSNVDTSKWKLNENPEGKLSFNSEELVITIPSSTTISNAGAEIVSIQTYNMTGCRAFVRLLKAPDAPSEALALLSLDSVVEPYGIVLLATNGNLQAKHKTPAVPKGEVLATIPYDRMTPVYLGISELNGKVTWETSPDAKTWTTIADLDIQLPSQLVKLKVGAFTYKPEGSAPGETRFDNVNIIPQ